VELTWEMGWLEGREGIKDFGAPGDFCSSSPHFFSCISKNLKNENLCSARLPSTPTS
jgi:hypothetical protein